MAEQTGIGVEDETVRVHLKAAEIVLSRPQHTISSPDPDYLVKKRRLVDTRDALKAGDVFYSADEFNLSWLPTLRAMWSREGAASDDPDAGAAHQALWDRRGQLAYRRNSGLDQAP
jgi:hypothetical protein